VNEAPAVADTEPLVVETEGNVRVLRLNRPHRLNAVNLTMYEALEAELKTIAADFDVRAVILTGTGRAFCAGADLKAHRETPPTPEERHEYIETSQRVFRALQTLPQPVVAAVNGHAIGAGLEFALSCDFVVIADDAKLRMPEIALATFVGGGSVYTLRRRVGHARAAELILLGRFFSPEEALEWGLANQVEPAKQVLPAARELAAALAKNAPISMRLAKRLLDRAPTMDPDEALRLEAEALLVCGESRDWEEGVAAFAEKREPAYRGV